MSLINDALKRAKESNKNLPQQASVGSPMEPVRTQEKSRLPLFVGCIICILCITSGVFFWKMSRNQSPVQRLATTQNATTPAKNKAQTPVQPQSRTNALVASAKLSPTSSVMTIRVATNSVPKTAQAASRTNAAPVVAATAVPAPKIPAAVIPASQPVVTQAPPASLSEVKLVIPPAAPPVAPPPVVAKSNLPFPELKLKAIIYKSSHPVAIINNASLTLGDEISGARLVKIEPRKVTVKWNNQTRDLSLE